MTTPTQQYKTSIDALSDARREEYSKLNVTGQTTVESKLKKEENSDLRKLFERFGTA